MALRIDVTNHAWVRWRERFAAGTTGEAELQAAVRAARPVDELDPAMVCCPREPGKIYRADARAIYVCEPIGAELLRVVTVLHRETPVRFRGRPLWQKN